MSEDTVISARRAFMILVPLFLAAALLACAVISVANDMYAFVKSDSKVLLSLTTPTSERELSVLLKKSGVIKNDTVFYLYLKSKRNGEDVTPLSGEWKLNSNMSYREILLEIF
jgi:cell division protein YceG involved in septum cleavage